MPFLDIINLAIQFKPLLIAVGVISFGELFIFFNYI